MQFDRVRSLEELSSLYEEPLATSVNKELSSLNPLYEKLIQSSPFFSIASVSTAGLDCSPRGDAPGFVKVIDATTLAIPDRRGNNRIDTLKNIVVDSRVALLFLIPGYHETLRINGNAYITVDDQLLSEFEHQGKTPQSAIIVEIKTVYFQCARALKRSRLWDSTMQVDPKTLPSAGKLIQSAINEFDAETYDAALPKRQENTLY